MVRAKGAFGKFSPVQGGTAGLSRAGPGSALPILLSPFQLIYPMNALTFSALDSRARVKHVG